MVYLNKEEDASLVEGLERKEMEMGKRKRCVGPVYVLNLASLKVFHSIKG